MSKDLFSKDDVPDFTGTPGATIELFNEVFEKINQNLGDLESALKAIESGEFGQYSADDHADLLVTAAILNGAMSNSYQLSDSRRIASSSALNSLYQWVNQNKSPSNHTHTSTEANVDGGTVTIPSNSTVGIAFAGKTIKAATVSFNSIDKLIV